jgi:hypothetical protein
MGTIKDIWDLAKELPAVRRQLAKRDAREEMEKALASFSPDLVSGAFDKSRVFDYFRWNDEADAWNPDLGEVLGTSFREIDRLWSNPLFYTTYEAGLIRFKKAGGKIERTMVAGVELAIPSLELMLLKTGLRQAVLGFPPRIAHHLDISHIMRRLGVDTQMIGIVGGHTAYFMRIYPDAVAVKTTDKRFIGRAWECYRDLSAQAMDFEEWVKNRSFNIDVKAILKDAEDEAKRIMNYADI